MASIRAVIKNGIVTNMIVADENDINSIAIPEGLSVGIGWKLSVGIGWNFDGQTFTPSTTPPVKVYLRYTYSGFIDALTREEAIAILVGAKTDPLLEMFIEIARARSSVNFNDVATRDSAPYLIQAGVLTTERLAELVG